MNKNFQPIDLSLLPPPSVVEVLDYETILNERRAFLIGLWPQDQQATIAERLVLDSDPLHKLLQENVYREIVWRQRVNEAAAATMLAQSHGSDLDNVVAGTNTKRLVVRPATADTPAEFEEDEDLRMRAQMAWEGLSTAGPTNAYIFHARSADGRVIDAECVSPSPAVVDVIIQCRDGNGTADSALIGIVQSYLSAEDRRPIADRLTVMSTEVVEYVIDAGLYLSSVGAEQEPILTAARAALEKLVYQKRRLGLEISRSAIYAALHVEGVAKVMLNDWTDISPTKYQSSYCTDIQLEVIQ